MSKLKAINPQDAAPSKPKVLIFGKPGVGKTWTALDFPNVYYIDTEGGANLRHYIEKLRNSGGVYLGPEQGSQDLDTILDQVRALTTEKHGYRTLVIDSISKPYNIAITNEGERLGDKNAYGADKKPAVAYIRRLINWLNRIDMNVILIAHEKDLWGGTGKEREVVGQTFDCYDKLEYELHLCLQVYKQGTARKARVKKSRLTGFPDSETMDWSYAEFAGRYGKDIIERETQAITLATKEQVEEANRLVQVLRISEEDIQKAFTKYNVSAFDEMETDTIEAVIKGLRSKLDKAAA